MRVEVWRFGRKKAGTLWPSTLKRQLSTKLISHACTDRRRRNRVARIARAAAEGCRLQRRRCGGRRGRAVLRTRVRDRSRDHRPGVAEGAWARAHQEAARGAQGLSDLD